VVARDMGSILDAGDRLPAGCIRPIEDRARVDGTPSSLIRSLRRQMTKLANRQRQQPEIIHTMGLQDQPNLVAFGFMVAITAQILYFIIQAFIRGLEDRRSNKRKDHEEKLANRRKWDNDCIELLVEVDILTSHLGRFSVLGLVPHDRAVKAAENRYKEDIQRRLTRIELAHPASEVRRAARELGGHLIIGIAASAWSVENRTAGKPPRSKDVVAKEWAELESAFWDLQKAVLGDDADAIKPSFLPDVLMRKMDEEKKSPAP
jgi:hypothetical protein